METHQIRYMWSTKAEHKAFTRTVPLEDERLAMIDIIPDLVWSCLYRWSRGSAGVG